MTDSSGMKVYHTPVLRPYDAAFILWGPTFFRLPPRRKKVSAGGVCRSERTWEMSGPVNITVMAPHMHLLGKSVSLHAFIGSLYALIGKSVVPYMHLLVSLWFLYVCIYLVFPRMHLLVNLWFIPCTYW